MPETPPQTPETPDAAEGGWSVESYSAPDEQTPDDTTARPRDVAATPEKSEAISEEPSPPVAASTSKPVAASTGKSKKPTLAERQKALTDEVNALTYTKHKTDDEIRSAQAQLARHRAELAAVTPKLGTTAPTTPEKPVASAMPSHPKYRDFETDEAYEAAVEAWHGQVAAWQAERETTLKTEITGGLEERLTRDREEQQRRGAERQILERIDAAKAAHADWGELAPGLNDLQSPWADPATGMKTPFLTDVVRNTEDGPEVLYYLMANLEQAHALAALHPTRPLRDAVVMASSPLSLLQHFATPEGAREFAALKGMHPISMLQAIGALSVRLEAAPGGPASGALEQITRAVPSAKPPVGTGPSRPSGSADEEPDFGAFYDRRERERLQRRLKEAGLSAAS